jgi:hypothetical protein
MPNRDGGARWDRTGPIGRQRDRETAARAQRWRAGHNRPGGPQRCPWSSCHTVHRDRQIETKNANKERERERERERGRERERDEAGAGLEGLTGAHGLVTDRQIERRQRTQTKGGRYRERRSGDSTRGQSRPAGSHWCPWPCHTIHTRDR